MKERISADPVALDFSGEGTLPFYPAQGGGGEGVGLALNSGTTGLLRDFEEFVTMTRKRAGANHFFDGVGFYVSQATRSCEFTLLYSN